MVFLKIVLGAILNLLDLMPRRFINLGGFTIPIWQILRTYDLNTDSYLCLFWVKVLVTWVIYHELDIFYGKIHIVNFIISLIFFSLNIFKSTKHIGNVCFNYAHGASVIYSCFVSTIFFFFCEAIIKLIPIYNCKLIFPDNKFIFRFHEFHESNIFQL